MGTTHNSMFTLLGLKMVWEVQRFLVTLLTGDEKVVSNLQTLQKQGTVQVAN